MAAPTENSIRSLTGLFRVVVTSFGFGHELPFTERQNTTHDVRRFRDPLAIGELRGKTARDPQVREHVLNTPGVADLIAMLTRHTAEHALTLGDPSGRLIRVAIGCGGGRHRAPVIASELGEALNRNGIGTEVEHRDIDKPLTRTTP